VANANAYNHMTPRHIEENSTTVVIRIADKSDLINSQQHFYRAMHYSA